MNTKPLRTIEFNKNNVLGTSTSLFREATGTRYPGLAQHAPVVLSDINSQFRSPGQGLDGIRLAVHLSKCSVGSAGTQVFGDRVPSLLQAVVQQNPGTCQPLLVFSSLSTPQTYQYLYSISTTDSVLASWLSRIAVTVAHIIASAVEDHLQHRII